MHDIPYRSRQRIRTFWFIIASLTIRIFLAYSLKIALCREINKLGSSQKSQSLKIGSYNNNRKLLLRVCGHSSRCHLNCSSIVETVQVSKLFCYIVTVTLQWRRRLNNEQKKQGVFKLFYGHVS